MHKPYRTVDAARSPINWVRRRARRLQRCFHVNRHEAVLNAWQDWAAFNPLAVRSAWTH